MLPPLDTQRFVFKSRIGAGAFAEVWLAEDKLLGVDRAIKLLFQTASADETARIIQEARSIAGLAHPHIITIHDCLTHNGRVALVLDLEQGSLASHVALNGPLNADDIEARLLELLDGLALAHAKGVIHRDIKPGNILVDQKGRWKLADFGIARTPDADTLTRTGAVLGSTAFMAPEQRLNSHNIDHGADIYAIGATAIWAFTGEIPFDLNVPVRRVMMLSKVPTTTRRWLDQATAYDCADRFDSVASLQAAIRGKKPRPRPTTKTRHWLMAVALLGLIAFLSWRVSVRGDPQGLPTPTSATLSDCPTPVTFARGVVALGGREAVQSRLADVDGDGALDALFVNQLDETVTIAWSLGTRSLDDRTTVSAIRASAMPDAGDFDGDGRIDVLLIDRDLGRVGILRGLGERRFAPIETFSLNARIDFGLAATLLQRDRAQVIVRTHNCVGFFTWSPGLGAPEIQCLIEEAKQVAAVDLDGDGLQELITVPIKDGSIFAHWVGLNGLITDSTALFRPPQRYPSASLELVAHGGAAGPEVHIWAGDRRQPLLRYRSEGDTWSGCRLSTLHYELPSRVPADIADVNGDGLADAIGTATCAGCTSNYRLYLGQPASPR